ncbi:hypothetical protein FJY68_11750 [candidate division WOR-3 bacterium]|uniref:Uncharacterized protein n=1 Tax=candidate division WOR-3 bacterium TaxID=2052148 RepID=A0A938BQU6_UNCW3|nr:hypothetical protein [candidate division WOR-3 bacterium]
MNEEPAVERVRGYRMGLLDAAHSVLRTEDCTSKESAWCSRRKQPDAWLKQGLERCADVENGGDCILGGFLEKVLSLHLNGAPLFPKGIVWEYDCDVRAFRLLELFGSSNSWTDDEKRFIFTHYKGRTGLITYECSKLLRRLCSTTLDIKTLYRGFRHAGRHVDPEARAAFGELRGVGMRLDYMRGLKGEKRAPGLMLLFYDRDSVLKQGLRLPRQFSEKDAAVQQLRELADVVATVATPVVVAEVFLRKFRGPGFALRAGDFAPPRMP